MPMSHRSLAALILTALLVTAGCQRAPRGYAYPETPRADVLEVLHGVEVADPYRWLEDSSDGRVREWIAAQNRLTRDHLASIPGRARLEERLRALWDHERYETPWVVAGRHFYLHNDGLQNHAVLYTQTSLDDEATP
jgi:prolyl oligopeptidase